MPTIGIYVPSIGIKSGFKAGLDPSTGFGESGPGAAGERFFASGVSGWVPSGV